MFCKVKSPSLTASYWLIAEYWRLWHTLVEKCCWSLSLRKYPCDLVWFFNFDVEELSSKLHFTDLFSAFICWIPAGHRLFFGTKVVVFLNVCDLEKNLWCCSPVRMYTMVEVLVQIWWRFKWCEMWKQKVAFHETILKSSKLATLV